MGEVSLWLTQKLNASMEEHEETSELRDGEDDHDIKNDDKLEGFLNFLGRKTQKPFKVYRGAYKSHFPAVTEVDNFEGVLPGGIMAFNLAGNYKPPHLARVNQVTETFYNVQWLKGIYKRKWVRGWSSTQIPKESVIYFDIQFHENKFIIN
ncbi:uncharacterized protein [Acropora muricata]|uniref:uncharacterized protein n=1 Tax=Acropora muricata TaxID=159855 RepID=UPI0034E52A40